ncbi:MAG: hypothetical protein RAK22_02925 [Nanoarchaeota archaeon]|nr:hypothetical protein [Nanoarchaeota archaeon]
MYFTELPPVLSISPTQSSLTVTAGGQVTDTISVSSTSTQSQISLSISGLPPGSSYSFSPSSETAPFTSVLTITVPSYAQAGTYSLEIIGSCQGVTKSAGISLTVNSVPPPTQTYTLTISVSPGGTDGEAFAEWGWLNCQSSPAANSFTGPVEVQVQGDTSLTLVAQSLNGESEFEQWQTSGAVYLANPYSSTTTATIEGSGTATAIFAALSSSPAAPCFRARPR